MSKKMPFILFIATILSVSSLLAQPQTPAYAEESKPECWAVIIGITDYKWLEDVEGCAYSAEELYYALRDAWGEGHTKLLLNNEAGKKDIQDAIYWLVSSADDNDTILFYFARHGASEYGGILASYDAIYKKYDGISPDDLNKWLDGLRSEKVVIILDTCYSGSFSGKLSDRGRVILASSGADEESWVSGNEFYHEWYNIFTYYLLKGLVKYIGFNPADRNCDYELSAEELFRYAKSAVLFQTTELESTQHPVLFNDYQGELSLLTNFVLRTEPSLPLDTKVFFVDKEECPSAFAKISRAPGSTHNLRVHPLIDDGNGTRYVFTSWSDGNASVERTISYGGEYVANYKTQYQLLIKSTYGELEGQGWYDVGSIATIKIASSAGLIIRHIFTGWGGDYSADSATALVTMDSPKVITASWRTDYTRLYILIALIAGLVVPVIVIRLFIRRRRSIT